MNELMTTIPQSIPLHYPDPASAIYTYLIIGFLVGITSEITAWKMDILDVGGGQGGDTLYNKAIYATYLPFLWPLIIYLNALQTKYLYEKGLYEDFKDYIEEEADEE